MFVRIPGILALVNLAGLLVDPIWLRNERVAAFAEGVRRGFSGHGFSPQVKRDYCR